MKLSNDSSSASNQNFDCPVSLVIFEDNYGNCSVCRDEGTIDDKGVANADDEIDNGNRIKHKNCPNRFTKQEHMEHNLTHVPF